MNQLPVLSSILIGLLVLAAGGLAHADSVTGVEKQVDEVKCKKFTDPDTHEVSSYCYQVTTGNYTLTATISAQTFIDNSIILAELDQDTLLTVEVGGFQFSGAWGDDAKSVLKPKLIKAAWAASQHEVCTKTDKATDECLKSSVVKDATVNISGNPSKNINIKIQGKFDLNKEYGQEMFVSACDDNGNGKMDADLVIGVGDFTITKTLSVNCKVKYKTVNKPDDSFDLVNMAITSKAD